MSKKKCCKRYRKGKPCTTCRQKTAQIMERAAVRSRDGLQLYRDEMVGGAGGKSLLRTSPAS